MESKEGMEALFRFATEGILIVNKEGEIVLINSSAEKLFGYEPRELMGSKIERLVPQKFSGNHQEYRNSYTHHPHARPMALGKNLFGLKKDGTEFPVEVSLSPYTNSFGMFVIAFIVDITHRKETEEKLRNYSNELEKQVKTRTLILEEAVDQLERTKKNLHDALEKERELNELKSRFVSMASHEFRTPLTTMMSSLTLVKRYRDLNDVPKQDRYISKIEHSITNLTDILDDFLSLSKLEEGKIQNVPERFDLQHFVAEIIEEMQAIDPDQPLIYDHQGENEAFLDQKLLKNVLLNLISNAVKFSPERTPVQITSIVQPDKIQLSVQDSGIGISAEDQKNLFERFFRGTNATHIQGTGLGLSIVARYIELMNGTIGFQSKENEGTTFTITLPNKSNLELTNHEENTTH